jgi:translation initiation factor 1
MPIIINLIVVYADWKEVWPNAVKRNWSFIYFTSVLYRNCEYNCSKIWQQKMSNKNKNKTGIVFSTNPDFEYDITTTGNDSTTSASLQKLRIYLDRKAGGKVVSRIAGFSGTDTELQALASSLKKLCGGGGSAKDGEILIQGDHRDKILHFLLKEGYSQSKKAGG